MKRNYTEEDRKKDAEVGKKLVILAKYEADCVGDDRKLVEKI